MTWDLDQLETLLSDNDNIVVTREENCLLIGNGDGLDAWLALSGEQIIIESILFSSSEVKDKAALNEEILKTHMLFPLTTIGISQVAEQDYYTAFGALSSQSKAESIKIELDALFHNVAAFLDAYQEHLH
ncbi:MAG: DUF2170 family protein [Aliiglaciecola sp.]|uniref:DUF2170 family protein n=1 Tax=unclassified Aliiglaciecola TaxID=2593648 RepID=UPI0026E3C1AC|nr:DUF2170 family protein [Aliiglaciecola sp. 3_MG-2023]MDO6693984.1 DUF2170 family protein [Aliiglaciecola sp. 3_MG-2023]